MSLFRPSRTEKRAVTSLPFNMDGGSSAFRMGGNLNASLALIPLYSACGLITDTVSTAPIHGYDGDSENNARMKKEPGIVSDPGVGINRMGWVSQCMMSLLMRGNAYGLIVELGTYGLPSKVRWLHPDAVTVDESGLLPEYSIGGKHCPRELIVHVPGIVLPGSCVGLSPLGLFRRQIETGLRVDNYSHDWYGDSSSPRGILYNKMKALAPEEVEVAKARFKASVADHDIMVTGSDWGWLPLAPTPADAQFIEATQLTASQIAAIYHVPAEDIGGTAANSLTYTTLEMNLIRFNQRAVLPWTRRIEAEWDAMLPRSQYVKFNLDATVRTDLKTRMDSYAVALDNGILTLDEVRRLEDHKPLTDAEVQAWQEQFVVPRPTVIQTTGPVRSANSEKGATA